MHVLVGDAWVDGFLDPTERAGWSRIEVVTQVALAPVRDQFFERGRDLAMLASYLRTLGPRRVLRKVRSRTAEQARNDAWLSVGWGWLDGDGERPVLFVAPSGPKGAERLLVPDELVQPFEQSARPDRSWYLPGGDRPARGEVDAVLPLAGWRPESGQAPNLEGSTWQGIERIVADPPGRAVQPPPSRSPVTERSPVPAERATAHTYTLFGYGQYAKTQIVPNLGTSVQVATIHEIDPLQIGAVLGSAEGAVTWDTSPEPRPDEVIDNAVLAGYHHTHAPLAVALLDRGARHVVIEKPIASSAAQLDALLAAMDRHPDARVHVAFQRRYSPFNELLRQDLGPGPLSLSATVYEVPLPALHWYRWPVVGNAVVSNGCHWIDHFLHVNDYETVVRCDVSRLADQTVLCLELADGATCSVSLRHHGAPRRGVRDLCTYWTDDATAVIEDNSRYRAERGHRLVRSRSCHPYRSHEAMYREFGRRILLDLPGDTVRSVVTSGRAVLDLAALVDARG